MNALLFLAACGPTRLAPHALEEAPAREAADVELVFSSDWSESASGPIVEGAKVHLDYDAARLPQCRGSKYGKPAWAITAFWRVNGGETGNVAVVLPQGAADATFVVPEAGELEVWFAANDVYGCISYDSDFGGNYRYPVESSTVVPDWMGLSSVAVTRATCSGGVCDADLHPLEGGFVYDTWARQRAAIAAAYFRVWEPGLTDTDSPDLWKELDVRAYWRFAGEEEYRWDWVDFEKRVGNDARYALPLRSIDPLPGATVTSPDDCPPFTVTLTPDGQYVQTSVELYFTVNGFELRPEEGEVFTGIFKDYVGLYSLCL